MDSTIPSANRAAALLRILASDDFAAGSPFGRDGTLTLVYMERLMSPQPMQAVTGRHTFVVGRAARPDQFDVEVDAAQKGPEIS